MQLNLIVIRTWELVRCVDFYRALGLTFQEERHGSGPAHFAADLHGVTFEIYPAKSADGVDSQTRLGFRSPDVARTIEQVRAAGYRIVAELASSQWGMRAVVRDPDGRAVELLQVESK